MQAVFALSFTFSHHIQLYGEVNNEMSSRFICTPEHTFHVSSLNILTGPEHIKAFFSFSSSPFYSLVPCVKLFIPVTTYDTFYK